MSTAKAPLFGDLLALARERWVRSMAESLAAKGYPGYRRSDALSLRVLHSGSRTLGDVAAPLGGSRQATRKIITGLVARGYAILETDQRDARRRQVILTPLGHEYAEAVVDTVNELNREVTEKVSPDDLAAAFSVLTFVKDAITTVG
jgi:DNA-binding MarR family transcriptional regulator